MPLRIVIHRNNISNPVIRFIAVITTIIIALIITAIFLLVLLPLIGITIAVVAGFIVFVISGILLSSIMSNLFKRHSARKKFNRLKSPINKA